jgi:hypothetical protein
MRSPYSFDKANPMTWKEWLTHEAEMANSPSGELYKRQQAEKLRMWQSRYNNKRTTLEQDVQYAESQFLPKPI